MQAHTSYTVLAGLIGLVAACGKGSAPVDKADQPKDVADAAKLVDLGQCETAVEKLKTYVSSHPTEAEAFLVLGDAWTCRASDASTLAKAQEDRRRNLADSSNEAMLQARTSYSSAVKLMPNDVRALTSLGSVEVFTGARDSGRQHLEAVRKSDPANRAALNLLALLASLEDKKAVLPLYEKNCNPSPSVFKDTSSIPPLCEPLDEGASDCDDAMFLADEVLDKRTYPRGTVVQPIEQTEKDIEFEDRLFPTTKPGTGWRLRRVNTREFPPGPRPALTRRVPNLAPASSWRPEDAAAKAEYDAWHIRVDEPEDLERRLGVVPDVIAGTVRANGPDVRVEGRFSYNYADRFNVTFLYEFTPVAFEQHVYESRRVPVAKVARMDISRDTAAVIAADPCLTSDEKRGLLARLIVPRVPLVYGAWAYRLDLQSLRLTIRNGEITLTPPTPGKAEARFVNGDLVVDLQRPK